MSFYLPVAEIEINLLIILFFGFLVGFMSGLFGVGGGFLMTPLLIFMGIPAATAVGTESVQILGSSVSGAIAHSRKKNIDYEIGGFLLIGGIFGSTLGVILFNFFKESGREVTGIARQCYEKAYFRGNVIACKLPVIKKTNSLTGDIVRYHIIPQERAIDIDNEIDFKICETLLLS